MASTHDPNVLPVDIPAPEDDGAARHLAGVRLPSLLLSATDDVQVDLAKLAGRTMVYIYPRTGRPGVAPPHGWDAIPGARGCTPQSCSFRDHFAELKSLGVAHLFGLSTQDTEYQREVSIACICRSQFCPTPACSSRTRSVCQHLRSPG